MIYRWNFAIELVTDNLTSQRHCERVDDIATGPRPLVSSHVKVFERVSFAEPRSSVWAAWPAVTVTVRTAALRADRRRTSTTGRLTAVWSAASTAPASGGRAAQVLPPRHRVIQFS
jgi:hypothetical protein